MAGPLVAGCESMHSWDSSVTTITSLLKTDLNLQTTQNSLMTDNEDILLAL
jgi:hypothetical protein